MKWLGRVYRFYRDGFRNMTVGRQLWVLILVKLAVMFLILRVFFFQPFLRGLSPEQRSDYVREELIERAAEGTPGAPDGTLKGK